MGVYDEDSLRPTGVDKLDPIEGDRALEGLSRKLMLLLLILEEVIDIGGEAGGGKMLRVLWGERGVTELDSIRKSLPVLCGKMALGVDVVVGDWKEYEFCVAAVGNAAKLCAVSLLADSESRLFQPWASDAELLESVASNAASSFSTRGSALSTKMTVH